MSSPRENQAWRGYPAPQRADTAVYQRGLLACKETRFSAILPPKGRGYKPRRVFTPSTHCPPAPRAPPTPRIHSASVLFTHFAGSSLSNTERCKIIVPQKPSYLLKINLFVTDRAPTPRNSHRVMEIIPKHGSALSQSHDLCHGKGMTYENRAPKWGEKH